MSYEKFITCIHDRHCNTLHGSIILNGIVVIEESTSRDVKKSQELCAVSRPKELADKWPMFVIGRGGTHQRDCVGSAVGNSAFGYGT